MIKVKCDYCGKEKDVYPYKLKTNKYIYCNHKCYSKHLTIINSGKDNASYKHGMAKSKIYRTWVHMKMRCLDPNNKKFYCYGKRGITVCKRWLKFKNFCDDMLEDMKLHVEKYGEYNTTLERKNVNGNYCKHNCSWKTFKEQASNKRHIKQLTFKEKTMFIPEWANYLGIRASLIRKRLSKNYPIEFVLTSKKFTNQFDSPLNNN